MRFAPLSWYALSVITGLLALQAPESWAHKVTVRIQEPDRQRTYSLTSDGNTLQIGSKSVSQELLQSFLESAALQVQDSYGTELSEVYALEEEIRSLYPQVIKEVTALDNPHHSKSPAHRRDIHERSITQLESWINEDEVQIGPANILKYYMLMQSVIQSRITAIDYSVDMADSIASCANPEVDCVGIYEIDAHSPITNPAELGLLKLIDFLGAKP